MRLIDADTLPKYTGYALSADAVAKAVENAPTIDAVEVVRCKDCRWFGRADKSRFYRGMDCLNKRIATINPDMDFCSRAERRTDEDN